jgi:Skp family chaperone for outer membrane proteins
MKTVRLAVRLVLGACCLAFSCAAAADAIATLNDPEVMKQVQQDIGKMQRPELDALSQAVATCSAASIGQRQQQFECERDIDLYWMRHSRERAADNYMAALGALYAAFDNNPVNPSGDVTRTYRHVAPDVLALLHTINLRYRQLDK